MRLMHARLMQGIDSGYPHSRRNHNVLFHWSNTTVFIVFSSRPALGIIDGDKVNDFVVDFEFQPFLDASISKIATSFTLRWCVKQLHSADPRYLPVNRLVLGRSLSLAMIVPASLRSFVWKSVLFWFSCRSCYMRPHWKIFSRLAFCEVLGRALDVEYDA